MSAFAHLPEIFGSGAAPRSTISDAVARGEIRRLARGVYTRNLTDPLDVVVSRNLFDAVAAVRPGAAIADRSVRLGARPAPDGSLFLVHERTTEVELPGVILRPRAGPSPIEGDLPLPAGLHMSSIPRALLENSAVTRGRGERVARTLTRSELEEWLASMLVQRGDDGFRALREQVRTLAPRLGLERELSALDPLMGALLGTRTDLRGSSSLMRARQRGQPYDPRRVELFERLFRELDGREPVSRIDDDAASPRLRFLPFFEAYFSNFIEGTEFAVEEAREIVFNDVIPPFRPEDAHDIIATYQLVSDNVEMSKVPGDFEEFLVLLKARHRTLMEGREDKHPGAFKSKPNRVGDIDFVAPTLVEGTLREGFDYYRRLTYPFARAVFQTFLVSEVHPFDDGNGRIARVMMNAELVAASEMRIMIPQVYRNNYLTALRALTANSRPDALVRTLDFAQRYTGAIDFSEFERAQQMLEVTHAFADPVAADAAGIRLMLPSTIELDEPWRIVGGPRSYSSTHDGADIDIGWAWDIARKGDQRTVRVEVAGGRLDMPELPQESRRAIQTHGQSAVASVLDSPNPPERVLVTSSGIFTR